MDTKLGGPAPRCAGSGQAAELHFHAGDPLLSPPLPRSRGSSRLRPCTGGLQPGRHHLSPAQPSADAEGGHLPRPRGRGGMATVIAQGPEIRGQRREAHGAGVPFQAGQRAQRAAGLAAEPLPGARRRLPCKMAASPRPCTGAPCRRPPVSAYRCARRRPTEGPRAPAKAAAVPSTGSPQRNKALRGSTTQVNPFAYRFACFVLFFSSPSFRSVCRSEAPARPPLPGQPPTPRSTARRAPSGLPFRYFPLLRRFPIFSAQRQPRRPEP